MRKKLRDLGNEQRHRFRATVSKFGFKSGYKEILKTVCVTNVCLLPEEKTITDHLWFTVGKQMEELDIQVGDIITFEARVDSYWKGYMGYRDDIDLPPVQLDYKLSRPTRFKVENREVIKKKIVDIKKLDKVTQSSIITFGKYKGLTLKQIIKEDFSYIIWLQQVIDKQDMGLYKFLNSKRILDKIKNNQSTK